jgi:hypothetical protein
MGAGRNQPTERPNFPLQVGENWLVGFSQFPTTLHAPSLNTNMHAVPKCFWNALFRAWLHSDLEFAKLVVGSNSIVDVANKDGTTQLHVVWERSL